MKKQGFTLVELLAVIAILAILVIIAIPNVVKMFNSAKKSTFESELKSIYNTAQDEWISTSIHDPGMKIYSKCSDCDNPLNASVRDELDYYIRINSDGKVVEYYATDKTYQYIYYGDDLKRDAIKDVEFVPDLVSEDVLEVSKLGRKIQVCRIDHYGFSLNVIITNVNTCYSAQKVGECFNVYLGGSSTMYLYKTHESNPGEETIDDCYQTLSSSIGSPSHSNKGSYNSTCSNKEGVYYVRVNKNTDIVVPSTGGCYSTTQISMQCLDGETEIEVYDKKKKKRVKKKLKDITYDDLILAWDFDKGEYVWAKPLWIMQPQESNKSITLTFSNGTKLKVIGDHRIFSIDDKEFVSCEKCNLGIKTYTSNDEIVTLVDRKIIEEKTMAYNLITEKHINMFANGILTSQGPNNMYTIENMKFVNENRDHFTDEELNNIPKEYIEGLNLRNWIVNRQGTKERTLEDMKLYVDKLIDTKKK